MKKIFITFLNFLFLFSFSQTMTLDQSFNSENFNGFGSTSTDVFALQSDGKLFIGEKRYNADGSLDASFQLDATLDSAVVKKIVIQPDGKIVFVFFEFEWSPNYRIRRLNSDGSIDESFNLVSNFLGNINTLTIQSDGKILIGGTFQQINGQTYYRIARLNTNGTIDTSFNVNGVGAQFGSTTNNNITQVNDIKIVENDKILVVGNFTAFNSSAQNHICKLNSDGTIDQNFNSGLGFSTIDNININTISVQNDGKYIIGGYFSNYNNNTIKGLVRLNVNGSYDSTFNTGEGFTTYGISAATGIKYWGQTGSAFTTELLANGKILVGGKFEKFDNTLVRGIVLLNEDGTMDSTFQNLDPTNLFNWLGGNNQPHGGQVDFIKHFNNKVFIGGNFNYIAHTHTGDDTSPLTRGVVKVNLDGTLDFDFNTTKGPNSPVKTSVLLDNGQILVGGDFTRFNGVSKRALVKLNPDGSIDNSFETGSGFKPKNNSNLVLISKIVLQPNNKVIVGGSFGYFNNLAVNDIIRLNLDGTLDTTFQPELPDAFRFEDFAIQSDGKIIVVCYSYNTKIFRLNQDGSKDLTFDNSWHFNNQPLYGIFVGNDDKIWVKSHNTTYRLTPNGSLDSGINNTIYGGFKGICNQPDDKIILYSNSNMVINGVNFKVVRLNPNYSIDVTFFAPDLQFDNLSFITVGPNGLIYAGSSEGRLKVLNQNGSINNNFNDDTGFSMGTQWGYPNAINNINIQPDGKILVGGSFKAYNGTNHSRFLRLIPSPLSIDVSTIYNNSIVYPNPTNDILNIHFKTPIEISKIELYNLLGEKININPNILDQQNIKLELNTLKAGYYILRMDTDLGNLSYKILKN